MNFLKNLYNKFRLWLDFKQLDVGESSVQDSFILGVQADLQKNSINIIEDEQDRIYKEALITIKNRIKNEATKFISLEAYLANNPDILRHAKENNEVKEVLRSSWDLRNKDVETEEDYSKMIETRIEHFKQLQKYNEERLLIKQIKAAKKQGDIITYNNLYKEWKSFYGRTKTKH